MIETRSDIIPETTSMTMTPVATPQPVDSKANEPELRNVGYYRREVMPRLGPEVFLPNPGRLGWYSVCALGAIGGYAAVVFLDLPWYLNLACAIMIGLANGTMGFIVHELLHGSVTKNQKIQEVLGFFGLFPFLLSPTYWKYNHNKLHHGKTQAILRDPDAFPTLRIYKSSKFIQFMFPFTPGSGKKRSLLYFFFWFSFHNLVSQVWMRFRNGQYDGMNQRRATIELAAQFAIMVTFLAIAGPANWIYVLVIPFALQNYLLMSYISTNHNLSPLTSENDPLVNSLSVTNHPALEWLNLNFGYHVEHHLFPTVSGKHTKKIHFVLAELYPQTYKCMPKGEAMRRLYSTARIYKNSKQLVHPETHEVFETI
jgi:fatty acid desaturase